MSTPVTFSPGNSKACYTSLQAMYNDWIANLTGTVPGSLAYVIQDATPSADDQDKLWIKTSSGAPVGQFIFYNGLWVWKHEVPASDNRLILFQGDSSAVDTLDGGNSNSVAAADGPFWQIETALAAKFPVGVGSFASGTSVAVTGTGGEEKHTLTTAELPEHTHGLSIKGYDNNGSDGSNGDDFAAEGLATKDHTLTTESTGGAEGHNNLPPYFGVYFLKRTARIYYVG